LETMAEDCWGCKNPLTGRTLSALDHKWHVDCWKCDDCGKTFFNGTSLDTFYHKGDRAVCDPCAEKGSPCGRCGASISYKEPPGSVVSAVGKRYHQKCFLCSVCSKSITSLRVSKDNIFCDTCPFPEEKEPIPEPIPEPEAPSEPAPEPTPEVSAPVEPAPTETPASTETPGTDAPPEPPKEEKSKPLCKGCNLEIDGRVVTAAGGDWHPDCFKCAECGTPFPTGAQFYTVDGKTICTSCNEKVAPLCSGCGNKVIGRVITALDRKWHKECFVCTNCKGGFEGGKFIVRGWNPLCHTCAQTPIEKS